MGLNVQNLIFTPVVTGKATSTAPAVSRTEQKPEQYVQNFASSALGADAILGGKYTPNFPRNSAEHDWIC